VSKRARQREQQPKNETQMRDTAQRTFSPGKWQKLVHVHST